MKKILVLVISIMLVTAMLCSCSPLGSYSINDKTVMTVGGIDVSYDMYKFCYNMALDELGDEIDVTKDEDLTKVRELALESIRLYCVQDILFETYGIELSRDDKKAVDAEIQLYIDEQEGMKGYKKWLSENHISGKFFRKQIERMYHLDPYLRELLFTGIDDLIKMDDETVIEDIEKNFYRYTQIFVACTEENYLEKRLEIDNAYEELEKGKSFSEVSDKYSDWTVNVERGVYTAKGEKILAIEETALELEISEGLDEGTYSKVVESYEGFHIIKRLPLDDEYIKSHLDDLGYVSATRRYNELLNTRSDELKVSYKDYFFTLTHEMLTKVEYA